MQRRAAYAGSVVDPRSAVSSLHEHTAKSPGPDQNRDGVSEPAEVAATASDVGADRLDRSWSSLIATGMVGGVDVSIGVIALVLVLERTGNELAASAAFAIGFVALALAGSELITENFLVPVATVADGRRPVRSLMRLWGGTLVANIVGGGVIMAIFAAGWSGEIAAAVDVGDRSVVEAWTLSGESIARAMIAGLLITLMTWMQQGVRQSVGGKIVAAFVIGFLIIYTHSDHVVVGSFEVLLGILAGATAYGWGDLAWSIPWWLAGNMLGGLGLVTVIRLIQARSEGNDRARNG